MARRIDSGPPSRGTHGPVMPQITEAELSPGNRRIPDPRRPAREYVSPDTSTGTLDSMGGPVDMSPLGIMPHGYPTPTSPINPNPVDPAVREAMRPAHPGRPGEK